MTQLSIAEVKISVRIEEIVRRRGVELKANSTGERMEGHCPFHAFDETPSFNVYVGSQRYHCFGCGADGDVLDFVQAFDVCSLQEAMQRLANNIIALPTVHRARTRVPRPLLPVPFPAPKQEPHALLTTVQHHYHQRLLAQPSLLARLAQERGVTMEGIEMCRLGYADGSADALLLDTAEHRQEAQKLGLFSPTQRERMWQRLIIPEYRDDACCWMIGRTLLPTTARRPKYLGLSLSKPLLGYGLALQRVQERQLVRAILVVEGAIDYVLVTQWHLPVLCVALLGTHASRRQLGCVLDLHRRTRNVPILLSLDADAAGEVGSTRLLTELHQRQMPALELPAIADAKDIGELGTRDEGKTMLEEAIERVLHEQRGASR